MPQTVDFVKAFSEKEREQRWQKAREFLQSNELDALLVVGTGGVGTGGGGTGGDTYFSNWVSGSTVIFPLKGEPLLLGAHNPYLLHITPETPKEELPWIKDIRAGARGAMMVAALKDKGLERSRVGVVGLGGLGPGAWEGWIPYPTWDRVVKRLPDCNFEDVTRTWNEYTMVKSEEELANVRRAAQVLELAAIEMRKATRPGISELDVWAAISCVESSNGITPRMSQFGSGPNTAGARPIWLDGVGVPRVLEPGDVVLTEIHGSSRGYTAQVQMAVVIPPVSPEDEECARLARQSYEAGLKLLRPGKTFEEVVEAMQATAMNHPKAWHITPLIHSMNPQLCIGPTGVNYERMPGVEAYPQFGTGRIRGGEVVLKPGMVFELEPNVCIGRHRVNIGGTVLVTGGDPEELNEVPCYLRLAGEA